MSMPWAVLVLPPPASYTVRGGHHCSMPLTLLFAHSETVVIFPCLLWLNTVKWPLLHWDPVISIDPEDAVLYLQQHLQSCSDCIRITVFLAWCLQHLPAFQRMYLRTWELMDSWILCNRPILAAHVKRLFFLSTEKEIRLNLCPDISIIFSSFNTECQFY